MEQLIADARREVVNLARTWLDADLGRKRELQIALFPEGSRFGHESFFFEPRNHSLTASVLRCYIHLQEAKTKKSCLASPTGFEPVLPP